MDTRDIDRLISQGQAELRSTDAWARQVDRDLARDRVTILNEDWMARKYPTPEGSDKKRWAYWPDAGQAPAWGSAAGGRPLQFRELVVGIALSFLYTILWGFLTRGSELSWSSVLSFFLLGVPLGFITWSYVVSLVRRVLDNVVSAPRREAQAQQMPGKLTDLQQEPTSHAWSSPPLHLSPSPLSSPPSPRSDPPVDDIEPITPLRRGPPQTAVASLRGTWQLRWLRSNQVSCRLPTLLIAQAGSRFRAILFCDGQRTTRIEGELVGNRAGFICWPYRLQSYDQTQEDRRGIGHLEILHNGDLVGTWCLGTGTTVSFQAVRRGDLPGS